MRRVLHSDDDDEFETHPAKQLSPINALSGMGDSLAESSA